MRFSAILPFVAGCVAAAAIVPAQQSSRVHEEYSSSADVVFAGGFWTTPDNAHHLWVADARADRVRELFVAPAGGGEGKPLNPDLAKGGDVWTESVAIAPNSKHVAFAAEVQANDLLEAFIVPIAGGDARRVSPEFGSGGGVDVSSFAFTPDSKWLVFRAIEANGTPVSLYAAPTAGGAPVLLSPSLPPHANVDANGVRISPDSKYVTYSADVDTDGTFELFSAEIATGRGMKLSAPGASVLAHSVQLSPKGDAAVFVANAAGGNNMLWMAPLGGGEARKLNGELPAWGDVSAFAVSTNPKAPYVVYAADLAANRQTDLFAVNLESFTVRQLTSSTPERFASGGLLSFAPDAPELLASYVSRAKADPAATAPNADANARGTAPVAIDEVIVIDLESGEATPVAKAEDGKKGIDGMGFLGNGSVAVQVRVPKSDDTAAPWGSDIEVVDADGHAHGVANWPAGENDPKPGKHAATVTGLLEVPGNGLCFIADPYVAGRYELFHIAAPGAVAKRVGEEVETGGQIYSANLSPDGKTLLYTVRRKAGAPVELFRLSF